MSEKVLPVGNDPARPESFGDRIMRIRKQLQTNVDQAAETGISAGDLGNQPQGFSNWNNWANHGFSNWNNWSNT